MASRLSRASAGVGGNRTAASAGFGLRSGESESIDQTAEVSIRSSRRRCETNLKILKRCSCAILGLGRPRALLEPGSFAYWPNVQTICLKPGTMAVGPKYLKYGTCVRLLELTEVRPGQTVKVNFATPRLMVPSRPNSLLSGLSPSASLFVRTNISLEEPSLGSDWFEACDGFSGLFFGMDARAGGGSGEQLSTARATRWL